MALETNHRPTKALGSALDGELDGLFAGLGNALVAEFPELDLLVPSPLEKILAGGIHEESCNQTRGNKKGGSPA